MTSSEPSISRPSSMACLGASLGIVAIAGAGFLYFKHSQLSTSIKRTHSFLGEYKDQLPANFHTSNDGTTETKTPESTTSKSTTPRQVFSDKFEISVPLSSLQVGYSKEQPLDVAALLTQYAQHSFAAFSTLPQSRLFRGPPHTFTKQHISNHPFQVGSEPICGVYRIVYRDDAKGRVEVGFGDGKSVEAAMILRVEVVEGGEGEKGEEKVVRFSTETLMWSVEDVTARKVPLAHVVPRWMHELTAMWIIDRVVKELISEVELKKKSQ
ncbi:hypothetical protein HK102_002159 [Quaeritorhiza haematococci]|nr:hypothetical protein HK102_002159 [Quaeritorhiza haematococci]